MTQPRPSRRDALLYSSAAAISLVGQTRLAGAALQHQHSAAPEAPESGVLRFFTPEQAAEVESIAALLIPADETPGAREAGVLFFIDAALATFDQDKQSIYRLGLEQTRKEVSALASHAQHVADLSPELQQQFLRRIEHSDFFGVIRTHTVMGFLGTYAGHGNRAQVGWKLIGFEDRFAFTPPFGYYDAEQPAKPKV